MRVFGKLSAALLAVGILAGCGAAGLAPGAPTSFDYIGPSGIRVSFDADVPKNVPPSVIEHLYLTTQDCMIASGYIPGPVPGPVVRIVSEKIGSSDGIFDLLNGQITLKAIGVMPHESVHYLLWENEFPNDDNRNHNHPAFTDCAF